MKSVTTRSATMLMMLSVIMLTACSTNNSTQQVANEQPPEANKAITITTSQGTQTLSPTVVTYDPETFEDPLEFINRPIFAFNDVLYRYVMIPVSKGYTAVIPDPVQTGIGNFFSNIREPLNLINHALQGEGKKSGTNLSRFLINSTIGLLGLFDPAEAWFDIEEDTATIGDTLESYQVGYGNYLVLPILGQSDFRNAFSTIGESILSPVRVISDAPQTAYLQGLDGFNEFAPSAPSYEELQAQSDDPYTFFRNLYLQSLKRDADFQSAPQQLSPSPANVKGKHSNKNKVNENQAKQDDEQEQ
ncbi:VacJ family lipoprotein [Aliiglaciecola sp. LCG003]|uniref:MlaA family lipoprotein n=1 Tax=Aliiglaciecola sp. LCG003 TaxID=3053655 RepID=UPI00257244AD|nr:VacJ family lipoprotein [Aliiglaciecola sp. LCG003]WJG09184.1 VacJ family lipoprotein [Aliiglaciecola sp. LCG003]